jgi:pectate lyase
MMLRFLAMQHSTLGPIMLCIGKCGSLYHSSTTGGSGATPVTVSTLSDLTSAVAGNEKKIVMISGPSLASWSQLVIEHLQETSLVMLPSKLAPIRRSSE